MNTEEVIKQKPKIFTYLKQFTRLEKRVIQQTIFKCQTPEKFFQKVSAVKFTPPYLFYIYLNNRKVIKTLDFAAPDPVRTTN